MFTARLAQLAALLFAPVAFGAPTTTLHFGPGPVVFPVAYEEWSGSGPLDCTGPYTNNGTFIVGQCANLAAPAQSIKLTPRFPRGATCSVQFWDAPGCVAAASEAVPLVDDMESSCIVPAFNGIFFGMNPPTAVSAKVTCDLSGSK